MIQSLLVAHRDRARLAEITSIASRFGLGVILARLGLERSGGEDAADQQTLPRRTRLAFEALGPTFVKLGQIMATRGDLLAPEWIAELELLHSSAPSLPFEELRGPLTEALGEAPETAFASLDTQPLAAASMAQVHRATLHDGREVVLKIRRPDIRPRVEADLRLIIQLASVVEQASAEARRFAPTAMARQLAEAISAELDFTAEGRNADLLRDDFAGEPRLVVPEIHWQWTSETLLVMDYVAGVPPRDGETLRAAGIDPDAIASLGADVVLDMVLVNGRFHGDPHPGNLLCLPGNRIALLDLGMVGLVSPRRREEFIAFVQSLNAGDPDQLRDVLAVWSSEGEASPKRLEAASERLVARHSGGRIELTALVSDFLPLMRQEGLTMPPDLLLIFKALVTVDGVLAGIQPGFDLSGAMRRSTTRIARAWLAPERLGTNLQALAWELARAGDNAPRLIRAAIRRLESAPDAGAEPQSAGAIRSAARWLAAAVIAGAAMVSSAILLGPPGV